MMGLRPELVKIEKHPKDIDEKPLGVDGKDPREFANSDEGKKIISMHVERMAAILNKALEKIKFGNQLTL